MPFELKPGQGTLHRTTEKKTTDSPDYFGELNMDGTIYKLAGWIKTTARGAKWLSLNCELPRPAKAALETRRGDSGSPSGMHPIPGRAPIDVDEDIPF